MAELESNFEILRAEFEQVMAAAAAAVTGGGGGNHGGGGGEDVAAAAAAAFTQRRADAWIARSVSPLVGGSWPIIS
eukprot:COSAG01_NODE_3944_length_5508_cov_66.132557_2_plen_76_part_00